MNIRKFSFKEGSSDKFWNISWDATSFTVCYGRNGTSGTSKTTESSTVDADVNKLIASKVKKGYVEDGSSAPTPTPIATVVKSTTAVQPEKEDVLKDDKPRLPKVNLGFTVESLATKVYSESEIEAMFTKGASYEFPKNGAIKDMDKAAYWYKKGADLGHGTCCFNLSTCYGNGTGVATDLNKKFYYLTKSAELGYKGSYNNLGICYRDADGTNKDLTKAFYYFEKAYNEFKSYMGAYNYAMMIKGGNAEGTEQQVFDAIKYSTGSNKKFTFKELAVCYETGYGTEVKLRDAILNYKKAEIQDKVDELELEYRKYINSLGGSVVVSYNEQLTTEEQAYFKDKIFTSSEAKGENLETLLKIMDSCSNTERQILINDLVVKPIANKGYYSFYNYCFKEIFPSTLHVRFDLCAGIYGESAFYEELIRDSSLFSYLNTEQGYIDDEKKAMLLLKNICNAAISSSAMGDRSEIVRDLTFKNFSLDIKKSILEKCVTIDEKITTLTLMLEHGDEYVTLLEDVIRKSLDENILNTIESTDFNTTKVSDELIEYFFNGNHCRMLSNGFIAPFAINRTDFLDKICCIALCLDKDLNLNHFMTSYKGNNEFKETGSSVEDIVEFTNKFSVNKITMLSNTRFSKYNDSNINKQELIDLITSQVDYRGALDFVLEKTDVLEFDQFQDIWMSNSPENFSVEKLLILYKNQFGEDEFVIRNGLLLSKFYKNFYSKESRYINNIENEKKYQLGKNYKCSNFARSILYEYFDYDVKEILNNYTPSSYKAIKNAFINDKDICEYIIENHSSYDTYTKFFVTDVLSESISDYVEFFTSLNEKTKSMQFIINRIYKDNPSLSVVVLGNLKDAKLAVRKTAMNIIDTCYKDVYYDEVKVAFEAEKDAKLKTIMEIYLKNAEVSSAMESGTTDELDLDSIINGLTVNTKKIDKYFINIPEVHNNAGELVDIKYLKAIVMVYAKDNVLGVSEMAKTIEADLNVREKELAIQALYKVFVQLGAEAKDKWMLYVASVHGGEDMYKILSDDISLWEYSRGAFAGEVVKALALNSNKLALLKVDFISRKYKHKQIKGAAISALNFAANELGLTREQLLDRIIPTCGFDINGRKVVDYGTRKFNVQLSTELDLVITDESGKKLKTLPAVGKNDDEVIANESSKEFKALKKQLKEVVSIQKGRLEATFSTDRKWTYEGFTDLFIKNPIMKQFALSLIWATYENGKIVETFRYMEDGSFNTKDEDEFTLTDGVEIGLVHPVELSADDIAAWTNQLSDYEINQIFNQLGRKIFTKNPDELDGNSTKHFGGMTVSPGVLSRILLSHGWERGSIEDAGFFDTFEKYTTNYACTINMNGMCVIDYDYDDAVIYEVDFFNNNGSNTLANISDKFYSEIMYQIDLATSSGTRDENWEKRK